MKKTLFLQFLLLFFIIISCKENRLENPPISQKGTIDLNNWSFEKNGAVNLKGEWEFYPGEFRNFSENQTKNEIPIIPKFIQVPSSWTESGYPMHGYATYRLKILLPKSKEKLAIFLAPIGTAYNFFANEKLLYQNGKPGVNKNSTEPLLKRKIISLPEEDKIDLIIQVSNFRFIKSGIFNEIKIDKEESLLSDQSWKISFDLVTFSAIFIFGIYHLVLFFFRKKDIIPLIFGIYCLIHSSRTLVMNDRWILDVFKELEFLLIIKVEFILSYLSSFFFAYYTYLFFPREFSRKMLKFLFLTLVGPAIFVLFTPFGIYSYTIFLTRYVIIILIIYIFYVLVLAVKRKRFASNLFFIGYFFYFSIAITGILKLFNLTHTPFWGNYGLLIFFIFQALIISNKFSLSFQTVENLSKELKIKSDNLEKTTIELRKLMLNLEEIVEERTGDLEKTKKELEFINKFSKLINSTNNLELVFEEAVKSINSSIEADVFLLQLLNSEKKELQYRCAHFPDEIDKELVKDYYSLKLPIDDGVGSYFVTISRKRTLYLKDLTRVSGEDFSEFDKKLIDDLKLNSVLQIPLIVKKEVIGIIHINK
ncbi:MAG: hypothetical protein KDK36_22605, partial [Leptospiraceae bacterium]|nr:hypothetical protein [Leptospiraceae bacterium]